MPNKKCFSINNFLQLEKLIEQEKNKQKIIIIFIADYLVTGFGIEWLRTIINLTKKKYKQINIKFYIDSGSNSGLSVMLLKENINYLKLKSNKTILGKINSISKKNKVVLNPKFVVEKVL
ncbi:hypothetical protein OA492_04045 [Pelagibacteraceae bacterium]|nr:hypothetical protein [Pelagibacteraceae bacterium]